MGENTLPDDLPVAEMIRWISDRYNMSKADLARMFQTTQSTIHYWLKTGKISYRNLKKLRASFYYLHNTRDPHADERKCDQCRKWRPGSILRSFLRSLRKQWTRPASALRNWMRSLSPTGRDWGAR